ncbi:MAG: SDR family NAD(P)-dependent oxidoreductase [Spirochaetia bacterium]|nr:SDR family NAD(P)-dependent oxidoreductase [Spirochaetia bacterium]
MVSTPSGLRGVPGRFAYSASKAAGHAMMETLGMELKAQNFRTVIFCPGYTRTGLRTSGLGPDGSVLGEEQAKGAKSPEFQAKHLCNALEKSQGIVISGFNGVAVYWLRTLWPSLLDKLMSAKLKRDF